MVGALADDAVEAGVARGVFHLGDVLGEFVVVDELGVAEEGGCLAEEVLDLPGVHVNLAVELVAGVDEGEGVVVGLADELAAAGVGELFEEVDDIGAPGLELVEADAGDGVGDAEVALVAFDEVEDEGGRGAVALVGDLVGDGLVFEVVEVEGVGVEDGVASEAVGLVDLEVEAD